MEVQDHSGGYETHAQVPAWHGDHDLSAGGEVLGRVADVARLALRRYDLTPDAEARLINVSENATFLVTDAGRRLILRVHRLGYHSREAIGSELDWLTALREEAGVPTPAVVPALDGARVIAVAGPDGAARQCVMFEHVPGGEPAEDALGEHFEPLGAITARMHLHARRWPRPAGFTRFHWDEDAAFGPSPRWGRWQDGAGVDGEARAVLGRLETALRDRLARFGKGPGRYGLIHADLRLANLLVLPGPVPTAGPDVPKAGPDVPAAGPDGRAPGTAGATVIDFDDCGFGWYLYDLAAALSFIEHRPEVPEMAERWLTGYRTVAGLPREDEAEVWTFILLRRLLLVAWIGSHPAVDIARELGARYTEQSCDLAERYLGSLR
ncbi:aminoglycoside phosphotransferase [Sphaerisporangium melleum]|uniref:Aminoglycoside phosphotransferase n=1 Tax=Sphaerisporangium melleum TaxID=321316 RepID=A0A917QSS2_9ACTN|nr:phosphotransferase [Sphaerisporangium melleum]GGK66456.1 aminoglycoside phosphotransferase [Sphaerisporangium melleum]GII68602.1 aminoglycoside phosphotransferase [Sphaerisporangium melleum]